MMPAATRIRTSGRDLVAFVTIPGEDEVRVRWTPPANFRCDVHGPSPVADCPHAAAVRNSPQYLYDTEPHE